MLQVILDVETKKTFDEVGGYFPENLGISFVGACMRRNFFEKGQFFSFFEKDLGELFPLLEKADVVIGFNIDGFDMPTLTNYYTGDISKIPTLDLMSKIKDSFGKRIALDAVAQETLGIGKTGDGLDAIKYYRSGALDKLEAYCLQDVKVTRDIYDHGLKTGKVKFKNKWNRLIDCPVDFSFTPQKDEGVQMALI
ncbi:MAG: ribonuclease H-like domain-containing protein [Candidatus Woesebacteria bacterium]|jgi:DEAD/DEAH box helicase domain-containing protein